MATIYTRSKYAAPGVPSGMARQGAPLEVFLHHSADREGMTWNTKAEQVAKVHAIDRQHRNQGWSMGGYHWVVFQRTGSRNEARAFQLRPGYYVPAAQKNHNSRTLAICVVGNGNAEELFEDTRIVIRKVIKLYCCIKAVGGHRDVVATSCPGNRFYAQLDRIAGPLDLKRV